MSTKLISCALLFFGISTYSQTNNADFNSFFETFKNAIHNNNITVIVEITNFPFAHSEIGLGQDTEKLLNVQEFSEKPLVPEFRFLTNALQNSTITIVNNDDYIETVSLLFDNDNYVLDYIKTGNEGLEWEHTQYFFGIIDNGFKYFKIVEYFS